jgi:hypothetical protein
MSAMNEMQQYLVEDHIHGLAHEAELLRAERERDHRTVDRGPARAIAPAAAVGATPPPASAAFAVAPVTIDPVPSTRVRLGRWLVGVGAAIAGATIDEAEANLAPSVAPAPDRTAFTAVKAANGPCDDGSSPLSHAA